MNRNKSIEEPALRCQNVTSKRRGNDLILDGSELYHFGVSLKDLGRQYCAVSTMDAMLIPSSMQGFAHVTITHDFRETLAFLGLGWFGHEFVCQSTPDDNE